VDTTVRKLLTLSRQPRARCTTATDPQPLHTNHTTRPRVMHNPVGSPSSADVMLSPTCTGLITVTEISTSFFFRKRRWGRAIPHPGLDPGKRRVSLILISFQDGLRRSTVVVRLPFRSSGTDYGHERPSAGNTAPHVGVDPLTLALLFGVMKGRNGRGDDHSRPDRLEVPPGAG
jgi:hypothetical protein